MIPLCDVIGSMYGVPMHVAIALSIGIISEITHDDFKDMIDSYSIHSRSRGLAGIVFYPPIDSIVKTVRSFAQAPWGGPWGGSTNFEAACDLVLKFVEDSRLGIRRTGHQ